MFRPMKQLYSNCCHAEVYTHHGNEGTNCWICPACKEGCGVEEGEETLLGYDVGKEGGDETIALYGKRYKDGGVLVTKRVKGLPLEEPEPYQPRVGDRVKLEGTVRSVGAGYFSVLFDGSRETCVLEDDEYLYTTLLSRKPPRTLTKAEAEALLTEKLGEQITIE